MQNQKNIFYALGLIVLLVLNQGCIPLLLGAAAGAGGVTYVRGKMEKNVDQTVKDVHDASLAGLKELDLVVLDDELTLHDSQINFEFDDGKNGKINIEALTEKASKLVIRVGILGDEEKSRMVLNAIEGKL